MWIFNGTMGTFNIYSILYIWNEIQTRIKPSSYILSNHDDGIHIKEQTNILFCLQHSLMREGKKAGKAQSCSKSLSSSDQSSSVAVHTKNSSCQLNY